MAGVLIVDDSVLIRRLLREILEAGGHQVLAEAENGIRAEIEARTVRPQVVTLDLVMPERGGLETLPHLLATDPPPAVIVSSASLDQPRVIAALRLGAIGFIVKPFSQAAVLASIDEALARMASQPPTPVPVADGFVNPSAAAASDRRDYVRLATSLPVRVNLPGGDSVVAHTIDVSAGGLLVANAGLAVGTAVEFRLSLGFGEPPIQGQARVVRVEGDAAGLAFERVAIADHERLAAYVADRARMI